MTEKTNIDWLNETNEILEDMEWQGVPIRETERVALPEAEWLQLQGISRWPKHTAPRWLRIKWWFRKWSERASDAYAVLTGKMEATDGYD